MIELDVTDLSSYLKQSLEICLHVIKPEGDNDYFIDTKNNITLVNENINYFIKGLISAGQNFDDIINYIIDYCSISSVKNSLSFPLNDLITGLADLGNDLYLFIEQSINTYLNKLQKYNLVRVSEIIKFPEERNVKKQNIISYLTLWHFCRSRTDEFKNFVLDEVLNLSRSFKNDALKEELEQLL